MIGIRKQVSLLMANGHPDARHYPIGLVWTEAEMVTNRINNDMATTALLNQMAVSSLFSKEGGEQFTKIIKELTDGG